MFIGRVAERGVIDDLLRRARAGRSGALVVCGDPGIGKSALLRYAEQYADGFTVLGARGYESESEIPFAGLADLLGPVLERVRAELAAAGGGGETTVRAAAGPPWAGALTPQELQVAMVVAGGASNQEAAASLFLSPKTIEYHLSNIYRKANLRSRNELAVLV